MRAIGYKQPGPIDAVDSLVEFETEAPELRPRDLLVEVRGISINPVDTKVRGGRPPIGAIGIMGYDAAGVVKEVGSEVSLFQVGDEVFYAGDITRAISRGRARTLNYTRWMSGSLAGNRLRWTLSKPPGCR